VRRLRVLPWAAGSTVLAIIVVTASAGASGPVSTPPPTFVGPSGSPSPFPTVLHTPASSLRPPPIHAQAAVLESAVTGQVLFVKSADQRRPVASLTKIMTAILVLQARSLGHVVTVHADALGVQPSTVGLVDGERITIRNLLYALLLQSANDAAVALADDVGGTTPAFVAMMNRGAADLHLTHTRFRSPNGLDDRGYSTARNMAALTRAALRLPAFAKVVATKQYDVPAPTGPPRHVQNRNALLWLYPGTYGVKTGFTSPAGHCLISAARHGDRRLIVVILGDVEDDAFDDGAALLNYGFGEFSKVRLVTDGQDVGSLTVGGQPIEALAGAALVRLVRRDRAGEVGRSLVPTPGLVLPVAAGEVVGRVVVEARGVVLGSVPAVARSAVASPPLPPPSPTGSQMDGGVAVLAELLRATFGSFL